MSVGVDMTLLVFCKNLLQVAKSCWRNVTVPNPNRTRLPETLPAVMKFKLEIFKGKKEIENESLNEIR